MRRMLVLLLILSAALSACGQDRLQSGAIALANPAPLPTIVDAVTDTTSFVDALRASGASISADGSVSLAFLKVNGTLLHVGDQRVQVYEYPADDDARADAARFSPDGAWVSSDVGAMLVNWFATPHLYRASRLIAVYVGDHQPTLALLETVLGAPFAGGANPYRVSIMQLES